VRLPSFVVTTEVVFGGRGERLIIRHDPGLTPPLTWPGLCWPCVTWPMWWVCAEDWTHCCSGNTVQSSAPSGRKLHHHARR
jgi:hypothetical protein